MIGRVTVAAVTALVIGATALLDAEKAKITAHASPRYSFATPGAYAWAQPTGTIRFLQTAETDPERWRQAVDATIVRSVDTELQKRGYRPAPAETADLTVTYYILVGPDVARQQMGQFLAPTTAWGLPPFAGRATAYDIAEQGSLIVDLASRDTQGVVWRGIIQARVHLERSDADRNVALARGILDLFRKFPRKPRP